MKTTMQELIEGFNILIKYSDKGDVCAEHDVIYASSEIEENTMSMEDVAKMDELGWHWDEDADSWAKFV